MTKINLTQLVWEEWNKEHMTKHGVTVEEVEEAIINIIAHRQGYDGRIIFIGRSGRRLISVIAKPLSEHGYYPITARDADKKERRMVYEKEKKQDS